MKRPRMDVNLEELDQIIERGTHAPLSTSEGEKLKLVLHALAAMLSAPRTTEKTKDVLGQSAAPASESEPGKAGPRAQRSFLLQRRAESRRSAFHTTGGRCLSGM